VKYIHDRDRLENLVDELGIYQAQDGQQTESGYWYGYLLALILMISAVALFYKKARRR